MKERIKKLIPKGYYCYSHLQYQKDGHCKVIGLCPYWKRIKDRPEQYDGWCDYLKKGDIELAEESEWIDCKTGEKKKAEALAFPTSLLWDMVKECGINEPEHCKGDCENCKECE